MERKYDKSPAGRRPGGRAERDFERGASGRQRGEEGRKGVGRQGRQSAGPEGRLKTGRDFERDYAGSPREARERSGRGKPGESRAPGRKPGRETAGRRTGRESFAGRYDRDNRDRREERGRQQRSRIPKLCPVSSKCGGCRWTEIAYEEQLKCKQTRFRKLMEPYCRPEPIIAMEDPRHYRNKVHAAFGMDGRHNIISGIYEERSHRIVPVDSCLIENRKADEIIVSIRGLLKSFKIRPYDEDTGYGLLRHVLIRVGHATGQIMVVLVLADPILPSKNNFAKALLKIHPEITTIVVNVNERDTAMVLGNKEQVIYGKGYIEDELCGMTFRISPKSFYQVNPVQTKKLYAKAMEYARLTGKETVLDAYCGTGTIGMIAAKDAAEVIGVELNGDAVRDAVSNAKRNHVSNIRFYHHDAGAFLQEMAAQRGKADVVFMDPPRGGSSEEFLKALAKTAPKRVVYISCNPDTLAEDLRILVRRGYRVEKCVAVDMFPFTDETEAVVSLTR